MIAFHGRASILPMAIAFKGSSTPVTAARNRKCLLSGRNCGQRCVVVVEPSFVTSTGVPPDALIRLIGEKWLAKMIVRPSPLQDPPRASATSQSATGPPPLMSIFFSDVASKNPIDRPSGDQNGHMPPSV